MSEIVEMVFQSEFLVVAALGAQREMQKNKMECGINQKRSGMEKRP